MIVIKRIAGVTKWEIIILKIFSQLFYSYHILENFQSSLEYKYFFPRLFVCV